MVSEKKGSKKRPVREAVEPPERPPGPRKADPAKRPTPKKPTPKKK